MKRFIVEYRRAKGHKNVRFFYGGSEVNETQAKEIKSVGGNVVTERNDEWFWRNWS